MKRKIIGCILIAVLITGCGSTSGRETQTKDIIDIEHAVQITLSDEKITVDGKEISEESSNAVYTANDIVYYEAGNDFTYGEGSERDEHTEEEAKMHSVVHISEPGTYELTGKLSAGQIAVDLGEEAKDNPAATVTLILNNLDITCSVAPAIIFYNVYECGSKEIGEATSEVNTINAGANIYIAAGSKNTMNGSYVARIYESYVVNEEGTEVIDSEKLHKYDGAVYSKMSMNVDGADNGILNINAENEGLDSELHLTINGGTINIVSGNDGINTNEDGISVTTINSGDLNIKVDGSTGEGDGIDSNGWLVINGGSVTAAACSKSGDAGIDSDMGIHINGGTVFASGNMLDKISDSEQNYVVMNFSERQKAREIYTLKDKEDKVVLEYSPENDFSNLIFSAPELLEGTYSFWKGEEQLSGTSDFGSSINGMMPLPDGMKMPEGEVPEKPEDMKMPEEEAPENMEMPKKQEGELSKEFAILEKGNYYNNVKTAEE